MSHKFLRLVYRSTGVFWLASYKRRKRKDGDT